MKLICFKFFFLKNYTSEIIKYHSVYHITFEPHLEKTCLMPYANNKGANQPVHPPSQIRAYVILCLGCIIAVNAKPNF